MTDLKTRRDQAFGSGSTLFYRDPVHIVRGEGVYLEDAEGRRYIDMYNNVTSVGHCHPHVVEAVSRQLGTLNVHSRYLHEAIVEYAERLTAKHHAGIESVVFSCTGTEANEVALMMARTATGAQGIICTNAAYHGNSTEVRRLTRCASSEGDVRAVPFPDSFRFDEQSGDPLSHHLDALQKTIDGFKRDGVAFAGMLVCPIFANEGLPAVLPGYLEQAQALVHDAGGLFICDEVQAGLCRTGHWWGYESAGFEPDIVTMGKPIGAGMPLAATAASAELLAAFRNGTRYFNTFASTPAQAAAGNAVLDVIEGEQVLTNVQSTGAWLLEALKALQHERQHPCLGDIRGQGLFYALEWVAPESRAPDRDGAIAIVHALKDRGFLVSNAGAYGNVIKLRPPLVFGRPEAEAFIGAFREVLADARV